MMDGNSSSSITPPTVCDDATLQHSGLSSASVINPSVHPSLHSSFSLCVIVAATLFALLWLIRRYGPCIFTEAKSPADRTDDENDRLLTRIHGKWYDISKFEHPGGPIAVSLIHRRDGTALFESHHPFLTRKKLMQILSKYQIPEGKENESGCQLLDPRDDGYYSWDKIDDDEFVSDLKELVVDYFTTIARKRGITINQAAKATPARWLLILSLWACLLGTLPFYIGGNWAFLFITPPLTWVVGANFWHDGLHFSLSTDWRVNGLLPYLFPFFASPWLWYHEHVIGHHAYPNVEHKDPDLAHAPQLMREHRSIKWKPTHVGQAQWHRVLFVWSVAVGIGLELLNDLKTNLKSSYNNVVPYSSLSGPRMMAHVLGRIAYVLLMHAWPFFAFPLWKALIWTTVPSTVLSVCFMVNTQINHLTNACAHASDETNFYKHQIVTAQNFGVSGGLNSVFCYYFSGGLNLQIEHHLFPNINHCHLPALAPGVKRICEKHGVPYHHASGYGEAMARHFAHTAEMEKKPVKND